jgi:hypothetical protein
MQSVDDEDSNTINDKKEVIDGYRSNLYTSCWMVFFYGIGTIDFLKKTLFENFLIKTLLDNELTKNIATIKLPFTEDFLFEDTPILLTTVWLFLLIEKSYPFFQMLMASSIEQLVCSSIDEEGRAYLSEIALQWKSAGMTHKQIKIERLMFILDHYRGRFIAWLQLPRFFSNTKTR